MGKLSLEKRTDALSAGVDSFVKNVPLLMYHNTFLAIVAVLEARDIYTAHHSERVSVMAGKLSTKMGLANWQIKLIETTAVVHDIGKVGIPDAILKKESKLNDEEWDEIKKHPVIGADILLKSGPLELIAESVRHHHERWDGNGYPSGLFGEDIPINARVIAICDSIDAMLAARVYRAAMPEEYCKDQIYRNCGVMYDPEIATLCLNHWDSIVGSLYSNQNTL